MHDVKSRLGKLWVFALMCGILLLAVVFVGYRIYLSDTTVVIWGGFRIPKSQLVMARVDTLQGNIPHAFEIHDHRLVLEIAEAVSHMKNLGAIEQGNFPPAPNYQPITQLEIDTKKYGVCGGNFWLVSPGGPVVWQDANGYYWDVPKALIDVLKEDVHAPGTTQLF